MKQKMIPQNCMVRTALAILFAVLSFTVVAGTLGPDHDEELQKAGDAYSKGMYHDAISIYQGILEQNLESAELYFNLGNAYFKASDIPRSILYYEKARKLDPADEDILYNLKIANSKTIDKIEEVPLVFYQRWWKNVADLFKARTWAWLSIAGMSLFFAMMSLYLFSSGMLTRRASFYSALFILFLTIHTVIFANRAFHNIRESKEAIVFRPTVTVKSSPDDSSIDLFVIHEGTKVTITDELGGWLEIKIASGSVGWMKSEGLERI